MRTDEIFFHKRRNFFLPSQVLSGVAPSKPGTRTKAKKMADTISDDILTEKKLIISARNSPAFYLFCSLTKQNRRGEDKEEVNKPPLYSAKRQQKQNGTTR